MRESLCQETPAASAKHQWNKETHYPYTKLINNQEWNTLLNCQVYNITNMKIKSYHPYYCMNKLKGQLKK